MELFSEIYGCYFTVVARVLEQAEKGLSRDEIERLVGSYGFYDSAFHLLPSLFSGEWRLLRQDDQRYYSRLSDGTTKRPLTVLEKSWLRALLSDPRIGLFLDEKQLSQLREALRDVCPLFEQNDFHIYDRHLDGDDYADAQYKERFGRILAACKSRVPLIIEYQSGKGGRLKRQFHPYKLCYSARDDKFRLLCAAYNCRRGRLERVTLNLARIKSVEPGVFDGEADLEALYKEAVCSDPIVLEISKERNALERCMLQFASFERQTDYDSARDIYICRLYFDPADETELLIRVLSFGPVVKVLGPEGFLAQIKERIGRQLRLNERT